MEDTACTSEACIACVFRQVRTIKQHIFANLCEACTSTMTETHKPVRPAARILPYSRELFSPRSKRSSQLKAFDVSTQSAFVPIQTTKPDMNIYVDGACKGNPGPGGWGVFVEGTDTRIQGRAPSTTNNKMELTAAIEALKWVLKNDHHNSHSVTVLTDSEYVQKGITMWITAWRINGWRTSKRQAVLNQDLWKELDHLASITRISWQWIKGHSTSVGNNTADALAKSAVHM